MPAAWPHYWKWRRPRRSSDPKPKRSILVRLLGCRRESGLNGSKHWLSKPTVPLADVKLMMNMDMVGRLRNNNLTVYGQSHCARPAQTDQPAQSRRNAG